MIRGSDGLDYEDLNARLLGEPAKTYRNSVLNEDSYYGEAYKKDYVEAYAHYECDGHEPDQCHYSACAQADFFQAERIEREKGRARDALYAHVWGQHTPAFGTVDPPASSTG